MTLFIFQGLVMFRFFLQNLRAKLNNIFFIQKLNQFQTKEEIYKDFTWIIQYDNGDLCQFSRIYKLMIMNNGKATYKLHYSNYPTDSFFEWVKIVFKNNREVRIAVASFNQNVETEKNKKPVNRNAS